MSLELFMNDVIIQPHMKICTECNIPKPATLEYFYREQRVKVDCLLVVKSVKPNTKRLGIKMEAKRKSISADMKKHHTERLLVS